LRTDAVAELIDLELVVGRDDDDPRVADPEVEGRVHQAVEEAVLLRVEAPAREVKHHWVRALQVRQTPLGPVLVRQFIVGKGAPNFDVAAHPGPPIVAFG